MPRFRLPSLVTSLPFSDAILRPAMRAALHRVDIPALVRALDCADELLEKPGRACLFGPPSMTPSAAQVCGHQCAR
jgi:hypothetical protein